jgi:antitoxin component YwqK of YwqJK toxin-antitoxin module
MEMDWKYKVKCGIFFMLACIGLSSCKGFWRYDIISSSDLTAQNKLNIERVKPYIDDSIAAFGTYEFDPYSRVTMLMFSDDSGVSHTHFYEVDHFNNDQVQSVSYYSYKDSLYKLSQFDRRGRLKWREKDTKYGQTRTGKDGKTTEYYKIIKGKRVINSRYEYYADNYVVTEYHTDGSQERKVVIYNDKEQWYATSYYRSGEVKTKAVMDGNRIISILEFEEDGSVVVDTKVDNGNGRWSACDEDGKCWDCQIAKGKARKCKYSFIVPSRI